MPRNDGNEEQSRIKVSLRGRMTWQSMRSVVECVYEMALILKIITIKKTLYIKFTHLYRQLCQTSIIVS